MGVSVKIDNPDHRKVRKIMSQLYNNIFPPGDQDHHRITGATNRALARMTEGLTYLVLKTVS